MERIHDASLRRTPWPLALLVAACSSNMSRDATLPTDATTTDTSTRDVVGVDNVTGADTPTTVGNDVPTLIDTDAPRPLMSTCALASPAFCETFDRPVTARGRSGDLDPRRWSASRYTPLDATSNDRAFGIETATLSPPRVVDGVTLRLPACRAGLAATVFPPDDTLICDPNENIRSNHLLMSVAAQNYGQNSFRIRQPFDFADRTGRIVFDAEGFNPVDGWISVEVTADPVPAPTFAIASNLEGGTIPANGLTVQFSGSRERVLELLTVVRDHVETVYSVQDENLVDTSTAWGRLNHFEIAVSQRRIEVYASAVSNDGVTFAPAQLIYARDVDLPFTRGYVSITTHNHATYKYTSGSDAGNGGFTNLDAWHARWDNVGFDGPVIANTREYDVPDSMVRHEFRNMEGALVRVMNLGYVVPDMAEGSVRLSLPGVDLRDAMSARLSFAAYYCNECGGDASRFTLRYRFNGGAWHERRLTAGERRFLTSGRSLGALTHTLDVPLAELQNGDNTIEFAAQDIPQNYPPALTAMQLVLTTR